MGKININVSATDYDRSSKEITKTLVGLEDMVHEKDGFVVTDSEFAFGWHFYVVSVRTDLVEKLADQMGQDFQKLKGKGSEKKFLSWLTQKMEKTSLRVKFAIKEEMESSKYGIF
ncbi:hypothetical protein [Candidatus Nitrosotenuis cloacae]|uniref:Exosome protein n=1 Tax=Candidatus Nitrosotenuis cloacae TaxID=1603555 RepID=A0A3G1B4Q7_9ARCH|nr:hypothetical protein [Candidatus Nitrosotenuis cloacae]AJZ75738.1 hypothetical protein SU86_004435 [Candidatus Nitrosotenuis cloacae]